MKTKTIGSTTYFVTKYFHNKDGILDLKTDRWSNKKYAFRDRDNWNEIHGKNMAFVFKAKQCIKVEE